MIMEWFLPLSLLIGVLGSRTALRAHHGATREKGWLLLLAMAWLPSLCWAMAQFVSQG